VLEGPNLRQFFDGSGVMTERRQGPRRGLRREEAATYVALSPTKFMQLVDDGRMPQPIKIDGCVIWDIVDLDRAFDTFKQSNPWDEHQPKAPTRRHRRKRNPADRD
jgi:predicted DNA-binding transcriptional regulator AlpA